MDKNILIIGNGFDIAHGLKTKYEEFITFVREWETEKQNIKGLDSEKEKFEKIIKKNNFVDLFLAYNKNIPGWIDFELLIEDVVAAFTKYILNAENTTSYYLEMSYTKLRYDEINLLSHFRVIFDDGYDPYNLNNKFYSINYGIKKDLIIKELRNQLDSLIESLRIYLKYFMEQYSDCDLNYKNKVIEKINPKYIINFNYTDTYKRYGIDRENVCYIHGSIDDKNMVLGIKDNDIEDTLLIYFKKYYQVFQKQTETIDENIAYIIQVQPPSIPDASNSHFFGHSMDITDGEVIKKIIEKTTKSIIYCYDEEDRARKIKNIIDIFGKKDAITALNGKIKFEVLN